MNHDDDTQFSTSFVLYACKNQFHLSYFGVLQFNFSILNCIKFLS